VRFELDRGDRRRSRLSLTRAGIDLVRKLRPIADDLRARVISGMNREEEDALRTLLRKVIRNLEVARGRG
jgi:DNA-binding MarR family transcriptional regulator